MESVSVILLIGIITRNNDDILADEVQGTY